MNYDPKQLAIEGHGAIEVAAAKENEPPLIVTLVGPIACWWEQWDSPAHKEFVEWRFAVEAALVKTGRVLVYAPYKAIRGAWHPRAQVINDTAIRTSDVIINLTPPRVVAKGTDQEIQVAHLAGVPVIACPPGTDLARLLQQLGLI